MTGSSYTYTPIGRQVKTLMGATNDLERGLNLTPIYDVNTTLNKKYNISLGLPTTHPTLRYFGIGIGGTQNVSGGNLSQPYEVSTLNMDLYTPLPFVVVPASQDLTAIQRAPYRMRVPKIINGNPYICYYLKVLQIASPSATYSLRDPISGVEVPYSVDYSYLTPTPPSTPVNGVVSSSAQEINVTSATTLPVTGTEVLQAVAALYAGDLRYARVSEIGIYSGVDGTVNATDFNGNAFSYTESLMTQLAIHNTTNGVDMSSPTSTFAQQFIFTNGSIVLV